MNIYSKYQLKDETENPFEINDGNDSITLNEKKKRDISKIDYAADSKEIKNRLIYFYKKLFIELFRFPEDITGWTRYMTLFTAFLYFLYPDSYINMALFLITEPLFIYKALYRKKTKWTIVGWGAQMFLTAYYAAKILMDKAFYASVMVNAIGISMIALVVLYFLCILYCLKYEKKIEIQNQIRKAENDKIRKIAKRACEEELTKEMEKKYFTRKDYSKQSNFSQGNQTEGLSDICENNSKPGHKSDIRFFNTNNIASSTDDPDSIDLPDTSSLDNV